MIDYYEPQLDLTLLGCGFLGGYHVGAIYLLKQVWPHKPYNRICGASCGGLLAALVLVGLELEAVLEQAMAIVRQLRAFASRPWLADSVQSLLRGALERLLPADAHRRCSGRFALSLTKLWSFDKLLVHSFDSRRELLDALLAGCFIPLWSGSLRAPLFKGAACIDGAYSDNLPKFRLSAAERRLGVRQVHICPFAGDVDVSPPDKAGLCLMSVLETRYYLSWANIRRTRDAMLPRPPPIYRCYLLAGHRDMKDYLLRHDLVKCRQCWPAGPPAPSACLKCLRLREQVDNLQVGERLLSIMQ